MAGNGELNVALLIQDNAPERIKAAIEERDKCISRVRELNLEIAILLTHVQVGCDLTIKREEPTDERVPKLHAG